MIAQLSTWVLAAALVQAEPEAAWLKAVPGDVDVVIRTRGLEASRDDVAAMLKAMSPALAESARPALEDGLAHVREMFGAAVAQAPCVALVRAVPRGAAGGTPFAVLVLKDDYEGVIKSLAGANEVKRRDGGYDAFASGKGLGNLYAAKGAGFVAFGPDEALIAAVARPTGATLDKAITPALAGPLLAGDAGAYVNVAALSTRYADQIAQGRDAIMAAMDQAGQQAGNAAAMAPAKAMYGALFDSLKYADALTLGLDASAAELHVSSMLAVKPGSDAAKSIAAARTGSAADLGRMPADSAFFAYMNLDAATFDRFQGLSMSMLAAGGEGAPELDRARARFRSLGSVEVLGAATFGGGMRALNVVNVADPKAYLAASRAMLLAMKGNNAGPLAIYKDVKVDEGAQTHRGFRFDHLVATLDLDKLGGQNPGGAAGVKAMFGGDTMSTWLGTDGRQVIQLTSPTWEDAKARVDAFLDSKDTIGAAPAYKALLSRLPDRTGLLVVLSAQGMLRMIAAQLAAVAGKEAKPAAAPAGEPALLGGSLTARPPVGYELHLVVPSAVGPVIEKGLPALSQDLPGRPQQR